MLRFNGFCALGVSGLWVLFTIVFFFAAGGRLPGYFIQMPIYIVAIATTGVVCLVLDHRIRSRGVVGRPVDRERAPVAGRR